MRLVTMRTSAGTRAGRIDGGVDETGGTRPTYPTYFAKYARALIGAHDPITHPQAAGVPA